jgi:transposase-like protein
MATHRIPKDQKDQILKRIKEEGISVSQAAKEHGISDATIYNWLSKGVTGQPTLRDFSKLKKENKFLTELVGEMTIALSQSKKKS